jgi:hypothetical protein
MSPQSTPDVAVKLAEPLLRIQVLSSYLGSDIVYPAALRGFPTGKSFKPENGGSRFL